MILIKENTHEYINRQLVKDDLEVDQLLVLRDKLRSEYRTSTASHCVLSLPSVAEIHEK